VHWIRESPLLQLTREGLAVAVVLSGRPGLKGAVITTTDHMDKPMRILSPVITLAMVLTLLTVDGASAGAPTDQLHGAVDGVLKTLSDPELKKEAKTTERRRLIRASANDIFDFPEISRRTLGIHWQARTPSEREEFAALFSDLLESSYISKIESYSGEKIQYVAETNDGNQTVVRTRIISKQGVETPIDYRMLLQDGRWRAYDVTIEGVSLVGNYRSQFNTIIQRSGYADLVGKLKAKRGERPGPREVKGTSPGPAEVQRVQDRGTMPAAPRQAP
jgi:phospholipid transport system substrate-binding protein